MPKHKSTEALDSDSTSDSGPDPEPAPKKKKKVEKKPESGEDEEHKYALSRNRFVTVREFRGKVLIDIREYYEKDGEQKPGKKGISLSVDQWRKLETKMEEINNSISAIA